LCLGARVKIGVRVAAYGLDPNCDLGATDVIHLKLVLNTKHAIALVEDHRLRTTDLVEAKRVRAATGVARSCKDIRFKILERKYIVNNILLINMTIILITKSQYLIGAIR